jgi:hypothetical protein
MKISEFFSKYENTRIDFDGYYGSQCVDLFNKYLVEVLDIKNPIQMFPVASAFQIWDYAKNNNLFERIENTPSGVPQEGDIIIFGKDNVFIHGHVGIFKSGNEKSFISFDQNYPLGNDCSFITHDYLKPKVIGWLRPKKFIKEDEVITIPEKPNLDKLISLLKEFWNGLDGNKTNITIIAIVITVIAYNMGYISEEQFKMFDSLFLALVGFSLRDAIRKK